MDAAVRSVSSAWVKGIVELFQNFPLDVPALFLEAGLQFESLNDHDARFPPERISALWDLAIAGTNRPDIGLAMPDVVHPASLDSVAYVMLTCPHLLRGLERFLRYLRIVSDAADIALHEEEGGYALTIALEGGGRDVPRARIEFVVVTILNICRWLSGRDMRPLAVDFPYSPPADLGPYHRAFHCPLQFDAPIHKLHFSTADLMAPLPMANPELAAMYDRMAWDHLKRIGGGKASNRIRELVIRRLPDGDPLRADIAREMCLGERTLQRRLQEEGTSFHELVDDIRRELAQNYLTQSDAAISQITYLLGFGDQSAFFRACKRWFDKAPGDYRKCARNSR
ncbi:MAG: hypothetical protein JWR22_2067 [Herminiimonas sp.]|nr:hypothetical protein [Herminiimonas sp.]